MSNANPLIPQGSLLEQQAKGRPHLRIALFIVAIHLVFLGGLLMQGCGKEETPVVDTPVDTQTPVDTNALYGFTDPASTGMVSQLPGSQIAAPLTNPAAYQTPTPAPGFTATPAPTYAPVETAPVASAQEYVVAKGDSFSSIGKKFGVGAMAIAKANPGVDSTRLKVGQKLQIPAAAAPGTSAMSTQPSPAATGGSETYVVKAGDTLSKIARNHGTTIATLREINGLKTDRINLGQKLRLPVKAVAPVEIPAPTTFAPVPGVPATSAPVITPTPLTR